jgi:hypothetical protein
MLLLLGFIALRLLGAALATLVYLLLAPLAVLAPALGEAGRSAFRLWLVRLVGAALSKLVYSVALGVALLVVSLLSSLDTLGWWTQWLLVSVFWWTAFEQRHRLLSIVLHERGEPVRRAPLATRAFVAGRTVGAGIAVGGVAARTAFAAGARAAELARRVRVPSDPSALPPERGRGLASGTGNERRKRFGARDDLPHVRGELAAQVDRVRVAESRGVSPSIHAIASLEARRTRLATALTAARETGDARRVVSLGLRAEHVDGQLAAARRDTRGSGRGAATPRILSSATGVRRRVIARRLDAAAYLPPGTVRDSSRAAEPLAGLAGMSPGEFRRSAPGVQRAARLEIERELTRRREVLFAGGASRATVAAAARESNASNAVPRRARQFGWRPR